MGEPALQQLDPLAAREDLHLAAGGRVGMAGGLRAPARARQQRLDDRGDHGVEVALAHRPARDPPQVELVGLADVQAIDDVAAVDEAGHAHEHVVRRGGRQRAQRRRDARRRVRTQHPPRVDVARVAPVAGGGVGAVAQRVVVVGDRDHPARAVDKRAAAPARGQPRRGAGYEVLHAMRAVARIGEVGQRQRPGQLVIGDVRHRGRSS
jgi:hypothetical protein